MRCLASATSCRRSSESRSKEDEFSHEYLEKLKNAEEESQNKAERVDVDYWKDPGAHKDSTRSKVKVDKRFLAEDG